MPNPKRRHSKRRTRTRRACLKCGYYKGREVIAVKDVL